MKKRLIEADRKYYRELERIFQIEEIKYELNNTKRVYKRNAKTKR